MPTTTDASGARCTLCAGPAGPPSWLGTTMFDGVRYTYRTCSSCRSSFCDPMPDEATLGRLYGAQYDMVDGDSDPALAADVEQLLRVLRAHPSPGVLLDFGCGSDAQVLTSAAGIGWEAVGVELVAEVAASVSARCGFGVLVASEASAVDHPIADVLHLGDVVEHLVDPVATLAPIVGLVRPGGLVVARGPLEANTSMFTAVVAGLRRLRSTPVASMPPYHVTAATAAGQRCFFERLGLREERFETSEASWPAPARLGDVRGARQAGLYGLRAASKAATALRGGRWGNRYFYVGRVPAPD